MSKFKLRGLWFSIHKWIGLLLAVLVIPISLTGAALVWDDGLDRLLHPARYGLGEVQRPLGNYVERARAATIPGERLSAVSLPRRSGRSGEGDRQPAGTVQGPPGAGDVLPSIPPTRM